MYGSFEQGSFDTVNRQDLNANFAMPTLDQNARGLGFHFAVTHNSLVWQNVNSAWSPATNQGRSNCSSTRI